MQLIIVASFKEYWMSFKKFSSSHTNSKRETCGDNPKAVPKINQNSMQAEKATVKVVPERAPIWGNKT
jgi:hypothetical protein